jgi:hypothetical protein
MHTSLRAVPPQTRAGQAPICKAILGWLSNVPD